MLARGVSRRRKAQIAKFLAVRTLQRMFCYAEFPRALGRPEALVTRMTECRVLESPHGTLNL